MTLISVIVPLHDHAATIADTLRSVFGQEPVEGTRVEVVVVDDGSTDGGATVVTTSFPEAIASGLLRLLRHDTRRGPAVSRNDGFRESRGDFVVFLDSDDLSTPDRFRHQLAAFAEHPEAAAVAGMLEEFAEPGWHGRPPAAPMATHMLGTLAMRRTTFTRIGEFDETLVAREVVDWGARLKRSGLHVTEVPVVVLKRRLHSGNHGLAHQNTGELLRTARAHLQARRPT